MAIDYLIGWTEAELETELRKCQEELVRGKSITQASAGDSTFQFLIEQKITERIQLILRKLSTINPTDYPPESTSAIRRTLVTFPQNFGETPSDDSDI